ncbi:MAG: PstA family ABC transporter permease [Vulcanisaeta sp.]|uniref:PstA family ABC transporter permease n=1 Tax=Vulcanisaeta sp. TaxID=2020871 RepID=UPI003D0C2B60
MRTREVFILSLTLVATILVFAPFIWLLGAVFYNGALVLSKVGIGFLFRLPPLPATNDIGGIGTVLEGSLLIVSMAMLIAAPISILSALYIALYEDTPLARLGSTLLSVMVEFPTIIVGISTFLVFGLMMGLSLSALTASIALSVIMIPYTTIQAIEAMRVPKNTVLEAAVALGLRDFHIARIMLTEGKEGVITGVLVGMGKIFGETAALLFTTTTAFNLYASSPLSPVSAIPVLIFNYAFSPYDNWHNTAWGASLILSMIVLGIYLLIRLSLRRGD